MIHWQNDHERERDDGTKHHGADEPAGSAASRPSRDPGGRAHGGERRPRRPAAPHPTGRGLRVARRRQAQPIGCIFRTPRARRWATRRLPMSTDRIEKKVLLRATRSRVWRAIVDPRELGAWFGME